MNDDLPLLKELTDFRTLKRKTIPSLLKALDQPLQRDAAMRCLVTCGDAAVEPLCRTLRGGHGNLRRDAAQILGLIADPAALSALHRALADTNDEVRMQAAVALGRIPDLRSVNPLSRALQDTVDEVSEQSARSLGAIALHCPALVLRAVLPMLDHLAAQYNLGTVARGPYQQAAQAIRTATDGLATLPLPAGPPLPERSHLPTPAGDPAHVSGHLPVPTAGPDSEG